MNINTKLFWLLLLMAMMGLCYVLKGVVAPFIAAFVMAYLLRPVVILFDKISIPRSISSLFIVLIFLLILSLIFINLLPLIYKQAIQFIDYIPHFKVFINSKIIPQISNIMQKFDKDVQNNVTHHFSGLYTSFFNYSSNFIHNIWSSGVALFNFGAFVLITPVITFYFIKDWDVMLDNIKGLVPKKSIHSFIKLFTEVDAVLSGFVRGQLSICIMLAVFYSLGLYFVGLKFAVVIGCLTGLFAFIPYVVFLLGFCISIIVSLLQFNDIEKTFIIVLIFVTGQIIEGGFIAPKLIGNKIGLHPIIILFLLFASGSLFGFNGILFALPVGAVVGVVIKVVINSYRKSYYYLK